MGVGKFNMSDIAKINISATGIEKTFEFVGPKPLKGFKNESNKKEQESRKYEERAREVSRRKGFGEGVGPE